MLNVLCLLFLLIYDIIILVHAIPYCTKFCPMIDGRYIQEESIMHTTDKYPNVHFTDDVTTAEELVRKANRAKAEKVNNRLADAKDKANKFFQENMASPVQLCVEITQAEAAKLWPMMVNDVLEALTTVHHLEWALKQKTHYTPGWFGTSLGSKTEVISYYEIKVPDKLIHGEQDPT